MDSNEFVELYVSQAIDGDNAAFEKLYNMTCRQAYFVAYSIAKNEDTAKDILQDSYVKAFSSLYTLTNAGSFIPWFKKIVANTAKNYVLRKQTASFNEMEENGEELPFEETGISFIPNQSLDKEETSRMMMEILFRLPEDQRLCIMSYYYDEMSVAEIASALVITQNAVKMRLYHARGTIKAEVQKLEKDGVKLYGAGAAAIPLMVWLLKNTAAVQVSQPAALFGRVMASAAHISGAATQAGVSSAGGAAVSQSGAAIVSAAAKTGFMAKIAGLSAAQKALAVVIAAVIAATPVSAAVWKHSKEKTALAADTAYAEETVDAFQKAAVGDIITFGAWPQTKVKDSSLVTMLNAQTLGADDTVAYGGSRYKRVYFTQYTPSWTPIASNADNSLQDDNGYYINTVYWFKVEPIQWCVLSDTNGELFVLAEKILGAEAYNQVDANVTWEACTLRSWLNADFCKMAFSAGELSRIAESTVVNAGYPDDGEGGCANTKDKVFLLSYDEVKNAAYGFNSDPDNDDAVRRAQETDYAKSQGLEVSTDTYSGYGRWWLRTHGDTRRGAFTVTGSGYVNDGDGDYDFCRTSVGIRPAIKLNLSSEQEKTTALEATSTFAVVTTKPAQTAATGDSITFGSYEQDNNLSNGKEPIVWRVLAVKDGKALLLSEKILDARPYYLTANNSSNIYPLHSWLNAEFYNLAFSNEEKERIAEIENQASGTASRNDAVDKVFLLSYEEATNAAYGFASPETDDTARLAQGTNYAKNQGLTVRNESSNLANWWLNMPFEETGDSEIICFIGNEGAVYFQVNSSASFRTDIGVRPALWINK